MKKSILIYGIFMLLTNSVTFAQKQNKPNQKEEKKNDILQKWIITIGGNMVNDDTGIDGLGRNNLQNYFNFKSWNYSLINLGADYRLNKQLYLNSLFTANKVEYKQTNNTTKIQTIVALDLNLKLRFDTLFLQKKKLEPYLLAGMGYTNSQINRSNFNLGFGSYYWLNENFALNLQILGKLDLFNLKSGNNYKQNTFGIAYKFPKK